MQTIGTKAGEKHRGDFIATCFYCGAAWYRSELRRNPAGQLICPDDQHVRDPVTLDRLNARALSRVRRGKVDGGIADVVTPTTSSPLVVAPELVVTGWDAASGVTLDTVGRVSTWTAVTGGYTLVQPHAGIAKPRLKTDGPNGRTYISFEGAHALVESTGDFTRPAPSAEPTFYWAVIRRPRWVDTGVWWGFEGGVVGATLTVLDLLSPPGSGILNSASGGGGDVPLNRFLRIEASFTGTAADYCKAGVSLVASGVSVGDDAPTDDFGVGLHSAGTFSYIDICELWILRAKPSAEQLARLDRYADVKYGGSVIL